MYLYRKERNLIKIYLRMSGLNVPKTDSINIGKIMWRELCKIRLKLWLYLIVGRIIYRKRKRKPFKIKLANFRQRPDVRYWQNLYISAVLRSFPMAPRTDWLWMVHVPHHTFRQVTHYLRFCSSGCKLPKQTD